MWARTHSYGLGLIYIWHESRRASRAVEWCRDSYKCDLFLVETTHLHGTGLIYIRHESRRVSRAAEWCCNAYKCDSILGGMTHSSGTWTDTFMYDINHVVCLALWCWLIKPIACHGTHTSESCHAYECVMPRISMRHVDQYSILHVVRGGEDP